jgi:hypothetical protein
MAISCKNPHYMYPNHGNSKDQCLQDSVHCMHEERGHSWRAFQSTWNAPKENSPVNKNEENSIPPVQKETFLYREKEVACRSSPTCTPYIIQQNLAQ